MWHDDAEGLLKQLIRIAGELMQADENLSGERDWDWDTGLGCHTGLLRQSVADNAVFEWNGSENDVVERTSLARSDRQ